MVREDQPAVPSRLTFILEAHVQPIAGLRQGDMEDLVKELLVDVLYELQTGPSRSVTMNFKAIRLNRVEGIAE